MSDCQGGYISRSHWIPILVAIGNKRKFSIFACLLYQTSLGVCIEVFLEAISVIFHIPPVYGTYRA